MRSCGILFPIFSLPSPYGIGCFSKEAYDFVDFLADSGQSYWQILPIGPTSYGDSPYQSFSTFAGNPYFIDLVTLIEEGLLTKKECDSSKLDKSGKINYYKQYIMRFKLLRKAYEKSDIEHNDSFHAFQRENAYWLRDYALFMAVKDRFDGVAWNEWAEDIRYRYANAMDYYQRELYFDIEFYEYIQYLFYKQWYKLKSYANDKGIQIIGDIPIYVAFDSADVWAHMELFQFDDNGNPSAVAGCPPDGFSATGQLWGNPLYRWDYHRHTGYDWWIKRMEACYKMYDAVRIDHFRGFDEYYSIPFGDETAERGEWIKGPGIELFNKIKARLGSDKLIIAEDLGYVTDTVRQLVNDCGYPGMRILEFAFDSRDSSSPVAYLPHNYIHNCVVYTGTHDNETLMGWLGNILPEERKQARQYFGLSFSEPKMLAEAMLRATHMSIADLCIIPLQDYLFLDNDARINKPSTIGINWLWRADKEIFTKELASYINNFAVLYGRDSKVL